MLYPLLFHPVLKDYIWGGRNLQTKLGRTLPPSTKIAESWEIAAHPDGDAVVSNGEYTGTSLSELQQTLGERLIGRRSRWAQERDKFPLLIKLLDAQQRLSVQVHPDDDYARRHEGNELGKTEMWVVLHAEADAAVILGVKEGTNRQNFQQQLEAGDLEPLLHTLPLQTGDFVCVPAGSLHAILGGLIIAEIQQNSNTTYRVYDWNRVGHDGKPRQLHIDQALDVINFDQVEPSVTQPQRRMPLADGTTRSVLCANDRFSVERWRMEDGASYQATLDGETFEIWGVVAGEVSVSGGGQTVTLDAVRFTLLPAMLGDFEIKAQGQATLLRAFVG